VQTPISSAFGLFNDALEYSSNIIRGIKPRIIAWVRHVAHMADRTGANRVLVGNRKKRDTWKT
jgi:hypothetical protein